MKPEWLVTDLVNVHWSTGISKYDNCVWSSTSTSFLFNCTTWLSVVLMWLPPRHTAPNTHFHYFYSRFCMRYGIGNESQAEHSVWVCKARGDVRVHVKEMGNAIVWWKYDGQSVIQYTIESHAVWMCAVLGSEFDMKCWMCSHELKLINVCERNVARMSHDVCLQQKNSYNASEKRSNEILFYGVTFLNAKNVRRWLGHCVYFDFELKLNMQNLTWIYLNRMLRLCVCPAVVGFFFFSLALFLLLFTIWLRCAWV